MEYRKNTHDQNEEKYPAQILNKPPIGVIENISNKLAEEAEDPYYRLPNQKVENTDQERE